MVKLAVLFAVLRRRLEINLRRFFNKVVRRFKGLVCNYGYEGSKGNIYFEGSRTFEPLSQR